MFEGFDNTTEEEEIIKLLECTTEVENLFMVSPVPFIIRLLELLRLHAVFCQSLLKRLDAKTKFLRKFIPLVQLAREFARERDTTVKRANDAEANARKVVEAELSLLQEENRMLTDQNLELTGLARSMFLTFDC